MPVKRNGTSAADPAKCPDHPLRRGALGTGIESATTRARLGNSAAWNSPNAKQRHKKEERRGAAPQHDPKRGRSR